MSFAMLGLFVDPEALVGDLHGRGRRASDVPWDTADTRSRRRPKAASGSQQPGARTPPCSRER